MALCLGLATLAAIPRSALAEDDDSDEYIDDPRRAEPEPLGVAPGSLWLSVAASLGVRANVEGSDSLQGAGMVLLGGKLGDMLKSRDVRVSKNNAKENEKVADKPNNQAKVEAEQRPSEDVRVRALAGSPAMAALARGSVRAALAAASSKVFEDRFDDMSTRARVSGLVPELRLRLAHVVDEDQSLAPTEYDPERITASGGTSLWMEGRATFRLDRLVYADDEVAIERLRADRVKLERDIADEVLNVFGQWQRARAMVASELVAPDDKDKAFIDMAVAEARLDALTDGWFGQALTKIGVAQSGDAQSTVASNPSIVACTLAKD